MEPFANRNPADSGFWDERFQRAFTPWEQGGVPVALQDFIASWNGKAQPGTCLIPGCGSAHEARYLCEMGWQVEAIDFSAVAVAAARATLGACTAKLTEADFFSYSPAAKLDLIYERAFFCALPPAMRPQVVRRWAKLLPAGGLLAGFFFFDNTPKGPPFGTSESELSDLLAADFELIADAEVCDSIPIFQGKERWKVWRRR